MFWKPSPETQRRRLFKGAYLGKVRRVQKALTAGVGVDITDSYGRTALCIAAKNNRLDVIRLLIESGADPNIKMSRGRTPIYLAIRHGQPETVKLMIELGARLDVTDREGFTPYDYAVARDKSSLCDLLRVKAESESVSA